MDAHPEASGGFAHKKQTYHLEVHIPDEGMKKIPEEKRKVLMQILSQDPRPSYQNDPERVDVYKRQAPAILISGESLSGTNDVIKAMERELIGVDPVSYTHLDVYKRQTVQHGQI